MNEDVLLAIKTYFDTNLEISAPKNFTSWYHREKFYKNFEDEQIRNLAVILQKKYGKFFSYNNLQVMRKMFLLYPEGLPFPLKHLDYSCIKVLVEIFLDDERNFYIDLCYDFNLNAKRLKYYILHDLYHKFLYCYDKYYDNSYLVSTDKYHIMCKEIMDVIDRIV